MLQLKSKLALGTAQFGMNYGISNESGQVTIDEIRRILTIAENSKIDTLDTASNYGSSESILGTLCVDKFNIVTKIPAVPRNISDYNCWLNYHIRLSQHRLGLDTLYCVLLHNSKDLMGESGVQISKHLKTLKLNGLVKKIGVSIYDPQELEHTLNVLDVDVVQAPLNLIDRRLVSTGWLKRLYDIGVTVHTRSSFLQGLLLMQRKSIPQKFNRWSNIWDLWHQKLEDYRITATAACLSYPMSLAEVDRVVVGVDSSDQLEALIHDSLSANTANDWSFMISNDEQLINPSQWRVL